MKKKFFFLKSLFQEKQNIFLVGKQKQFVINGTRNIGKINAGCQNLFF
jgi:hypothetical protein